jgi:hypothetical protein
MLCPICKKKEIQEDGRCLYYACSQKQKTNHFKNDAIKGKFKIITKDGLIVMRTNYMSRVNHYLEKWGKKKGHKLLQ